MATITDFVLPATWAVVTSASFGWFLKKWLGKRLESGIQHTGHANTHITATVYSRVLEKDEQASADVWEEAMGAVGRKPNASLC